MKKDEFPNVQYSVRINIEDSNSQIPVCKRFPINLSLWHKICSASVSMQRPDANTTDDSQPSPTGWLSACHKIAKFMTTEGVNRSAKTRVLILGGGFGGFYAALHLDKTIAAAPNVEVTLVSRENFVLF